MLTFVERREVTLSAKASCRPCFTAVIHVLRSEAACYSSSLHVSTSFRPIIPGMRSPCLSLTFVEMSGDEAIVNDSSQSAWLRAGLCRGGSALIACTCSPHQASNPLYALPSKWSSFCRSMRAQRPNKNDKKVCYKCSSMRESL